MKCLFERGSSFPLCCRVNNIYYNYLTGQAIKNNFSLNFINEGVKNLSLIIKEVDFNVYQIVTNTKNIGDTRVIGYNYQLNGLSNYLDLNKQPFKKSVRQNIIEKLINGKYIQKKIWGDCV